MDGVRPAGPEEIRQRQVHQKIAQRCRIAHASIVDDREVRIHSFVPHLEYVSLLGQGIKRPGALGINPLFVRNHVLVTAAAVSTSLVEGDITGHVLANGLTNEQIVAELPDRNSGYTGLPAPGHPLVRRPCDQNPSNVRTDGTLVI